MDEGFTDAWSMRWADAEVARVDISTDQLHIRLSTAPVRAESGVHRSRGPQYASGVDVQLSQLQSHRIDTGCVGRVAEGQVTVDGLSLAPLTLPLERHGAIVLRLRLANGTSLEATGVTLRIHAPGGLQVTEYLHC